MGSFIFHITAALAELERSIIRERTRAGLASARARGRKGGRPKKLTHGRRDRRAIWREFSDDFTATRFQAEPTKALRWLPVNAIRIKRIFDTRIS